jgi:hypothetical protein
MTSIVSDSKNCVERYLRMVAEAEDIVVDTGVVVQVAELVAVDTEEPVELVVAVVEVVGPVVEAVEAEVVVEARNQIN